MTQQNKELPWWEKLLSEIEPLIIEKVKEGETNVKVLIWVNRQYPGVELNGKKLEKIKRKHGITR